MRLIGSVANPVPAVEWIVGLVTSRSRSGAFLIDACVSDLHCVFAAFTHTSCVLLRIRIAEKEYGYAS